MAFKNSPTEITTKASMRKGSLTARANIAGQMARHIKAILLRAVGTARAVGSQHEKMETSTSVAMRMIKSVVTVDMFGPITASMKDTSKAISSKSPII